MNPELKSQNRLSIMAPFDFLSDDLSIIQSPLGVVADVRSMIHQTRSIIAGVANAGLTLLHWRIGKRIQSDVLGNQRAEYGKEIVAALGRQLADEFGQGFGAKNLHRMMQFVEAFPNVQIVHALSTQLGWTHFQRIIPLKNDLRLDFYNRLKP